MHIKMFTKERIDSHPRSSVNIPLRGMDGPVPRAHDASSVRVGVVKLT